MNGTTPEDASLLDAVRGVRWPARQLVSAGAHGVHRSRRRGAAAEFTEYRPYSQGDDPRRLDWKLLARSDRAFIRLSDDHALLPTVFAVDTSPSMAFPVETLGKRHHARRLTLALASIAHAAGDPVGLCLAPAALGTGDKGERDGRGTGPGALAWKRGLGLASGNDRDSRRGRGPGALDSRGAQAPANGRAILTLPPRTRSGVVGDIASALGSNASAGPASLARLFSAAAAVARGARVVLVSDFLTNAADATAVLAAARVLGGAGGEVYAIHVVSPEELDPSVRNVSVEDPEDPSLRRPLIGTARHAYIQAFADWRATVARDWRAAGATYILSATDEAPDHAVRRIVASPS